MKSVKRKVIQLTLLILIVSCQDSERKNAEYKVKKYAVFVDSVHVLKIISASENWDVIQNLNDQNKVNAKLALNELSKNKENLKVKMDQSILKFEKFKGKVMIEKEKLKILKAKQKK